MSRDALFRIESAEQFEAIGSPVRLEMVEFFGSRGPMSVAEIAEALGRPADGLYHHLRKLEGAGIIREVGTRQRGKQIERVFDVSAEELRVAEDASQIVRIWRLISSHAERNLSLAIESGKIHFRGPDRNLAMRIETAQLDKEARGKVLEHLDAIRAIFSEARVEPKGEQASLTFAFVPSVGRGREESTPDRGMSQSEVKKTRSERKRAGTPPKNTASESRSGEDSGGRARTRRKSSS